MDTVKIDKLELLATVKNNREAHRDIFLRAQVGYRAEAIKELDRMLDDAKAGKKISRYLTLVEPTDQTKDYDRVIRMLEMSVDGAIVLNERQFAQYVLDDWVWKEQFTASNSRYL